MYGRDRYTHTIQGVSEVLEVHIAYERERIPRTLERGKTLGGVRFFISNGLNRHEPRIFTPIVVHNGRQIVNFCY